jgi:hypothetical protein
MILLVPQSLDFARGGFPFLNQLRDRELARISSDAQRCRAFD